MKDIRLLVAIPLLLVAVMLGLAIRFVEHTIARLSLPRKDEDFML